MPSVSYTFEGEQKEQAESLEGLKYGFLLAVFMIYALMAVPFKSYLQPLMVMSAIPFGIVGAIWGHAIMGWKLTILSVIGIVALAGVVVNDSLVLVDFVNRQRREHGKKLHEAVGIAGRQRFRPILLTSLTTFAGLTPMLFEKSLQAQFLIPMAISLAYGVMFSTFITLLLVPANYIILEDFKRVFSRLLGRGAPVAEPVEEAG
jgi:multidrug efflux pump subunit AcrB